MRYFLTLYSLGDIPVISLNTRLNVDWFLNPHSYEISVIDISPLFSISQAFEILCDLTKSTYPTPSFAGKSFEM